MAEYIDREALVAKFDRMGLGEHSFVEKVFSDGVRTIIAEMPAADVVKVVHAYWIEYETMSWRHESPKRRKYYRCSNCRTASAVRHKACPNCFARMDADTQEREETK